MSPMLAFVADAATQAAASQPAADGPGYHVAWEKWLTFYDWEIAIRSVATLVLILLLYTVLARIFRKQLEQSRLIRPTTWGVISAAIYFALLAAHPYLMIDQHDILALVIHKTFVAILLIVAIRYLDRLIIMPLLTRVSKSAPSRLVHQIIIVVISIFVLAGYCSWAFNIEIGSFLAGSAVISIVLGLALQETLGNFFSGMVLQASVPFQPGDWIKIGEIEGRVIEMTWRAVTLLSGDNNNVLIPNSTVAKEKIINFHSPSVATATSISIGLDYNLPPNEAKRVLIQAAKDADGVLSQPPPGAALASYQDSAILYKVIFWIDQPNRHGAIEEAVRANVWYRLNQAGLSIPFPVRSVELTDTAKKQAEALQQSRVIRLAAIKKSSMFADVAPELQEQLADRTRDFYLAAGQTFYHQGDAGNSLFILQSGTVGMTIHAENAATPGASTGPARDIDAGDVSAPAIFGDSSALTGHPRGASVRAKTDVRAIEVDQQHLQDLFTHDPALATHFSNAVAQREKQREELLQKMGAATPAGEQQGQADTVLARMRRLFTFGKR